MLLRNLNPREGLYNGSRMIYEKALDNKVLQCTLVGSERSVLIPRIIFMPKDGEYSGCMLKLDITFVPLGTQIFGF